MVMDKKLQGIGLDAPARIGATVFQRGVSVVEVILRAQQEYNYHNVHKLDPEPVDAHKKATDPWITEVYAVTNEYHKRTGKKVVLGDLLEAALAETVFNVSEDDRGWFMVQLKERLA